MNYDKYEEENKEREITFVMLNIFYGDMEEAIYNTQYILRMYMKKNGLRIPLQKK